MDEIADLLFYSLFCAFDKMHFHLNYFRTSSNPILHVISHLVFVTDIGVGFVTSHIANLVLLGVVFLYLYSLFLHPFDIHLLLAGVVYLFYLPLLNILLPLYAVCNIVDQTWGTRDDVRTL